MFLGQLHMGCHGAPKIVNGMPKFSLDCTVYFFLPSSHLIRTMLSTNILFCFFFFFPKVENETINFFPPFALGYGNGIFSFLFPILLFYPQT